MHENSIRSRHVHFWGNVHEPSFPGWAIPLDPPGAPPAKRPVSISLATKPENLTTPRHDITPARLSRMHIGLLLMTICSLSFVFQKIQIFFIYCSTTCTGCGRDHFANSHGNCLIVRPIRFLYLVI